jgi:monoterpene epsilon-lactone hydrolase
MSPWCDLTYSGNTIQILDGLNPILDYEHCLMQMACAYAGKTPLASAEISPLFAEVATGFPPTIITTGTRDLLLSDRARLSAKLRKAGVEVTLQVAEGMWHVFEYYAAVPEAKDSIKNIAAFLRKHW